MFLLCRKKRAGLRRAFLTVVWPIPSRELAPDHSGHAYDVNNAQENILPSGK